MESTETRHPMPRQALAAIRKVREFARAHNMLKKGDRVLVAVSGGADSMAMLHVLHALAEKEGISLYVAHLNHNLRGEESAADALFVEEAAKGLRLPVTAGILRKGLLKQKGRSPQDAAREERYAFLQRVAQENCCNRIATGHTADDVAETVLMALIRGGGTKSLGGIPPVSGNVIRPILCLKRSDILTFLESNGILFREDSSNLTALYLRNRVRLELIPLLQARFNPAIVDTIANTAEIVREDAELIEEEIGPRIFALAKEENGTVAISLAALLKLPVAARRRAVRSAWQRLADGKLELPILSSRHTASVLALATDKKSGDSIDLPGGIVAQRGYGELRILRQGEIDAGVLTHGLWELAPEGPTPIPELGIEVHVFRSDSPGEISGWTAVFDSGTLCDRIFVRTRREGDAFCPSGMGGARKKLQDFFVDAKVPRDQRDRVPLLCSGADIIWVVGYRRDERFIPSPGTLSSIWVKVTEGGSNHDALRQAAVHRSPDQEES